MRKEYILEHAHPDPLILIDLKLGEALVVSLHELVDVLRSDGLSSILVSVLVLFQLVFVQALVVIKVMWIDVYTLCELPLLIE